MTWYGLFKKIGKQPIGKMSRNNVVILIDGKELPCDIKFKVNGLPYLILK